MELLKRLVLVLPLLTLTGCFDLIEEIWIQPDGSGRVRIDFGISSALFALPGIGSKEETLAQIQAEAVKASEEASKDPDVKSVKVETKDEGDSFHLIYELEVKDVTRLPEVQKRLTQSNERLKNEKAFDLDFRIEESSKGYQFVQSFGRAGTDGGMARPTGSDLFAQQMLAVMFADRGITVRLHGPEFASHNGQLAEDAKSVEWKIPFSSLLAGGSFHQELRAEVVTNDPMIFYVGGAALALLLVLAGVTLGRKKG